MDVQIVAHPFSLCVPATGTRTNYLKREEPPTCENSRSNAGGEHRVDNSALEEKELIGPPDLRFRTFQALSVLSRSSAGPNSPSMASRIRSVSDGIRWPYRLSVMAAELCPMARCTATIEHPPEMSTLAKR